MAQITIDTNDTPSEALRKMAYALVDAAKASPRRDGKRQIILQAKTIVNAIEDRANGGDTSALREEIDIVDEQIEELRMARMGRHPQADAK